MARPIKTGLDYFPLDVDIDDKLELIEAEHGLTGFAIVIKLWQRIYKNGYYIDWNQDNELLFARKLNLDVKQVNSVVRSCLHRNLLDNTLYKKHRILSSVGIQKRYITACSQSKRKSISFIKDFNLLSSEFTKLITELIKLTPEESTQSKVKESKVKESKEEEIKENNVSKLSLTERQGLFYEELKQYTHTYPKETLRAFYEYWTEPNRSHTKQRHELEKTWNTALRLKNWARREKPASKPTPKPVGYSHIKPYNPQEDDIDPRLEKELLSHFKVITQ